MRPVTFTISMVFLMAHLTGVVAAAPRVPHTRASKSAAAPATISCPQTLNDARELTEYFTNQLPELNLESDNQTPRIRNPFQTGLPEKQEPLPAPKTKIPEVITISATNPGPPPPLLKISGLVWNSNRPQAIINKIIVNINDQIEGWTITNISKEGVTIRSETREVMIKP